jgi:homoserine kinase
MALALEEPFDVVCVEFGTPGLEVTFEGGFVINREPRALTIYPVIEEVSRMLGREIGARVRIRKGIMPASGLGSSGADAAAMAYALNKHFNLNLGDRELVRLAALGESASAGTPHMDNVSDSLLGGLVRVNPVNNDLLRVGVPGDICIVVVITGSKPSTGEMRKVVPREVSIDDLKNNSFYTAMVLYSVLSNDAEALGRAVSMDSVVEPRRARLYPHYEPVKRALTRAGALGVALAGAGPSLFGIFRERPGGEYITRELIREGVVDHRVIITRPSNSGIVEVQGWGG